MKYLFLGSTALVALAIAGAATPASSKSAANTYTVYLGEQSEIPGGFKKFPVLLNQFLPSRLVVAAGDRVTFSSASFHTASYAPKPFPLFLPDPAKGTYAGIVGADGQPFHFDAKPKFIYNGQAFAPFGPKAISGKTPASTGALSPQGPKAPPATATYAFPTPGTYQFFCAVHPGMKGTVVVKPTGSVIPKTPAQVQADALATQTKGWEAGKKMLASVKIPANTVDMGLGGKVTALAFLPKVLTVTVGTTVNFVNKAPSEPHNLTFGPPKYIEKLAKQIDLFPQGPKGPNQVAPVLAYGSDPKPYTYDGKTHGNGFFATELTSGSPIGLPRSSRVTFTAPGTYKYFCWIHGPDMGGTIVVK